MENFAWDYEHLKKFSKHYKTGEVLSRDLFDKLLAAKNHNAGMFVLRQMEFALYDFTLHTMYDSNDSKSYMDYLREVRSKVSLIAVPEWNRFPNSFGHIFSGGYAAGYYSYMWAEVLDCDAFQAFKETGDIFNKEMADKFRKYILTPGGIDDGMTMYKNFRGREPKIDALLKNRGLLKEEPQTLINGDIEKR
jgi:Zn-dependent oligopeptidase